MYEIVAGVLNPPMVLTISFDGVLVDLSNALSITLVWEEPDGSTRSNALTEGQTGDFVIGVVNSAWVAGDTDQVGPRRGQVQIVWPVGSQYDDLPRVFPTDGEQVTWFVNRRIGS